MSIFDGNTRAGMSSYQAAMAKGMPPDQAEAYTHGLDVLGILDYTNLPAVLRQFQQLKQPPAQQPPTPNVAQQIQMLANAKQSGGMGAGLGAIRPDTMPPGQMAPAPPAMDPMARGLGGMNAGAMENPSFAGGGIVAFQQGGGAQTAPNVVAANLPKPRSMEDIYKYYADIMGQGYVPAFRKEAQQLEDIEKEQGIGEYAQSLADEATLLDTQEKRSVEELERDRIDLRRQEAADIAGAAAGSRSLLEAMAKARSPAVQRERELEKEIRKARAEREKARIDLQKAKDNAKATRSTAAMNRVDKAEERMVRAEENLSNREFELYKIDKELAGRKELTGMEIQGRKDIAQIEADLRSDLQERAGEIEERIKARTASPEDKLGWMYITALNKYGPKDQRTVDAFKRYSDAMALKTAGRSSAVPINVDQAVPANSPAGGAPPASDVKLRADAILAAGG